MKTIKTAILGAGFMGRVHLEAVRRVEGVECLAIAARNAEAAQRLAAAFSIPKVTTDYREVLRDSAVDAVHICTPNAQHYAMAKEAILAGKHVLCEKPLTTTVAEAEELVALARQKSVRNCVCHNLRYYPMVQQMRRMREAGDLGEILLLQGTYSQDWLLYDTDWNWRVDANAAGRSRCMADIGSHFFDMAEHVSGLRLSSLCADLQTFHPKRRKPKHSVETFANKLMAAEDYEQVAVETEDFGAVVFRMGPRARGAMTASQVSAGRKNRFSIEVYGAKASIAWDQERPDELWSGRRDQGNQIFIKDPALLKAEARTYADLPGGHSEGYDDTFKQVFRWFYRSIAAQGAAQYPQFVDGLRQMTILDAVLESHRKRAWIDVPGLANQA
jgi:predicted dehydrogenase